MSSRCKMNEKEMVSGARLNLGFYEWNHGLPRRGYFYKQIPVNVIQTSWDFGNKKYFSFLVAKEEDEALAKEFPLSSINIGCVIPFVNSLFGCSRFGMFVINDGNVSEGEDERFHQLADGIVKWFETNIQMRKHWRRDAEEDFVNYIVAKNNAE